MHFRNGSFVGLDITQSGDSALELFARIGNRSETNRNRMKPAGNPIPLQEAASLKWDGHDRDRHPGGPASRSEPQREPRNGSLARIRKREPETASRRFLARAMVPASTEWGGKRLA